MNQFHFVMCTTMKDDEHLKNIAQKWLDFSLNTKYEKRVRSVIDFFDGRIRISPEAAEKIRKSFQEFIKKLDNDVDSGINTKNGSEKSHQTESNDATILIEKDVIDLCSSDDEGNCQIITKTNAADKNINYLHTIATFSFENIQQNFEFTSKLRPWIEKDFKTIAGIDKMLKKNCLRDMFKCMLSFCDGFHTNSKEQFYKHLRQHEHRIPQYMKHFSRCSYCKFSSKNIIELLIHIINGHSFDFFGCPHCFYRSVCKINVKFHMKLYHKNEIDCEVQEYEISHNKLEINYSLAHATAKESMKNVTPPIFCPYCKNQFYAYKSFENHFKIQHEKITELNCIKCLQNCDVNKFKHHLQKCHKILPFHCVYCRYGSENSYDLKVHLVNDHSNQLPLFSQRLHTKNEDLLAIIMLTTDY